MSSPNLQLLLFFVDKQKIACDDIDFSGRNPFLINAKAKPTRPFSSSMQYLLTRDVNYDSSDNQGSTPLLLYYAQKNFNNANNLLTRGANINHIDKGGLTVLTYATIRRDNDEIERLVKVGADINKVNHKGRNLLHVSINMSSASVDATFETE
jgi:ankyrin repeat protein